MLRQLLTVVLGFVLCSLAFAGSGYLLYRFSDLMSEPRLGLLVRSFFNPCIAFLVGACVGALAKSRPVVLAVLSLAPWMQPFGSPMQPFRSPQCLDAAHLLILISSDVLYLCIGAAAATFVFRRRARTSNPASISA
jgi:hypothetical protein